MSAFISELRKSIAETIYHGNPVIVWLSQPPDKYFYEYISSYEFDEYDSILTISNKIGSFVDRGSLGYKVTLEGVVGVNSYINLDCIYETCSQRRI